MRGFPVNPVLAREVKERVRGRRSAVIITLYLTALTLILWVVYESSSDSASSFGQPLPTQLAEVGFSTFDWVLFVMLLLVLFLVPAQSAGAIAGERERQTLVPLQITMLSPHSILLGKIGASTAFVLLLLVAAIPLLSIAYLIGGVTIPEVIGGVALVFGVGVCLATMCAAISTFARRVQSATVMSYGLMLLMVLGTGAVYGAAAAVDSSRGADEANPPTVLLLLNPVATVGDLVGRGTGFDTDSPLDAVKEVTDRDDGDIFDPGFGGEVIIDDFGGRVGPGFQGQEGDGEGAAVGDDGIPFWGWSLFALAWVSAASFLLAARRLRTPAEAER